MTNNKEVLNQDIFGEMINVYLCDKDAAIQGSKVEMDSYGNTCLYVQYQVSKGYADNNDLWYRDREMCIILKRAEGWEGASISSYANMNR